VDQFLKLVVNLIIVALTAVASVAPASGGVFFFENNSGISIPDSGAATPYPSTINVSGVTGTVTHVVVGLVDMTHTFPDQVEILLVDPTGQRTGMLMSDAGGSPNMDDVNLTFNECAPRWLGNQSRIFSGTYRPSAYATAGAAGGLPSLPLPAPPAPYGPGLSEFNGMTNSANGTWSLYVNDHTAGDSGSIIAWNITIFTNAGGLPGGANPVPCGKPDFDGDGRADTVVYQDATGNWFVEGSAVGFFTPALNFGGPGFIPVAGDYDGDGITDPAVYQASSGNWFVVGSSSGFFTPALNFGGPGFTPVPRDYDGDGKTDVAVYQTSTGNWFVVGSTAGFFSVLNFGGSGFSPVSAAQ
jgi:subtilisin-like proprotein convertase family protein